MRPEKTITQYILPVLGYGQQSISSFIATGTPSRTDISSPIKTLLHQISIWTRSGFSVVVEAHIYNAVNNLRC
jgi:hypothetical protein